MLNIISLTALRKKVTWPWKVVKNLMKGLDSLGYPYILNGNLNSTKRLWIHDDVFALRELYTLHPDTKLIIGPNLYSLPRKIPHDINIDIYPHLMPSTWVVDFWKYFGYSWILESWPTWIDTFTFAPSVQKKTKVLVYFKQRREEDLDTITNHLKKKGIQYEVIYYGKYSESVFLEDLQTTKYVIWIGCSESQGIALEEILACDIPILLWDITRFDQCGYSSWLFTSDELLYTPVTSAPYFDTSCGMRIFDFQEISVALDTMEKNYTLYKPRIFIETHLPLALQAKRFIELYDKYYNLSYIDGLSEVLLNKDNFRSNILIGKLFDIYDSKPIILLRKIFRK